jgi:hypothetical protein
MNTPKTLRNIIKAFGALVVAVAITIALPGCATTADDGGGSSDGHAGHSH